MKRLLPFLILIFLTSCGSTEQKPSEANEIETYPDPMELERKSLATGYRSDELFNHLKFGMNRREIFAYLGQEVKAGYVVINTDSTFNMLYENDFFTCPRISQIVYDQGKMFRTNDFYVIKDAKRKKKGKDFLQSLFDNIGRIKHCKGPYKGGVQNSVQYWLIGNRRIDYFDTLGYCAIVETDISVEHRLRVEIKEDELKKIEHRAEISEKLKSKAKRDWPDDYSTQEYWINEQMEAYDYMETIPDDPIKRKAQRDWPLDFSTQKYWYGEQVAAKERLN